MKKICILLIFVLCLTGCYNDAYYWQFNYSHSEIKEIKIIEIVDEFEYQVVKDIDIDLAQDIYDDISKLKMRRYGTNLSSPSGKCFLIVFNTGEYDIISQKESKHFMFNGSSIEGYNSWLYFDKEEFTALIDKYLSQT
ncbi:MAG: hypothetical protein IJW19_04145 [Clostridia bacterium]|nr:hypothetical protein [Clostridia bacterium]